MEKALARLAMLVSLSAFAAPALKRAKELLRRPRCNALSAAAFTVSGIGMFPALSSGMNGG